MRPGTTVSLPEEEDQDVRQQMFGMHCMAPQFRSGGKNRVSEQEAAELCETEWVSGTQKAPGFCFILLWHPVDTHH